jgi:hypothetical protein
MLAQLSPDQSQEAETCFRSALPVAGRQQARSLELRVATNLAGLWRDRGRGKCNEAWDLVAPIYDTPDRRKAVLDELM